MYLNKLELNEKQGFLNLAAIVAEANGTVEETEDYMLEMYCAEMQIEGEVEDKSLGDVLDELKSISAESKNIIVFELIGLCLTDGRYDEKEKENIKEICDGLGVSDEKLELLEKDMADYYGLITKISQDIFI